MCSHEIDPDMVRWGLHLLDICPTSISGSCNTTTKIAEDPYCPAISVREGYYGHFYPDIVNVENDEVIAHALQEELSCIATEEASRSSCSTEDHVKESVLAQEWNDHTRNTSSDVWCHDKDVAETCSCHEQQFSNEDHSSNTFMIEDESMMDSEVEKRFNQMVPVPHVPKVNGEIPSVDEATTDHYILLDRLQLYDLDEYKVEGDGNCQFRALSDQIYRTPEHHKFVRRQMVKQLRSHPEMYDDYVPMPYEEYLNNMSKNGEWGDHVTLQAAADSYGVKIFVLTSYRDTCYIEILPQLQRSKRVIFLSFWAEVHYNSIYPSRDMPYFDDAKKKKKWWRF